MERTDRTSFVHLKEVFTGSIVSQRTYSRKSLISFSLKWKRLWSAFSCQAEHLKSAPTFTTFTSTKVCPFKAAFDFMNALNVPLNPWRQIRPKWDKMETGLDILKIFLSDSKYNIFIWFSQRQLKTDWCWKPLPTSFEKEGYVLNKSCVKFRQF